MSSPSNTNTVTTGNMTCAFWYHKNHCTRHHACKYAHYHQPGMIIADLPRRDPNTGISLAGRNLVAAETAAQAEWDVEWEGQQREWIRWQWEAHQYQQQQQQQQCVLLDRARIERAREQERERDRVRREREVQLERERRRRELEREERQIRLHRRWRIDHTELYRVLWERELHWNAMQQERQQQRQRQHQDVTVTTGTAAATCPQHSQATTSPSASSSLSTLSTTMPSSSYSGQITPLTTLNTPPTTFDTPFSPNPTPTTSSSPSPNRLPHPTPSVISEVASEIAENPDMYYRRPTADIWERCRAIIERRERMRRDVEGLVGEE